MKNSGTVIPTKITAKIYIIIFFKKKKTPSQHTPLSSFAVSQLISLYQTFIAP
jgi:hypothetical protein